MKMGVLNSYNPPNNNDMNTDAAINHRGTAAFALAGGVGDLSIYRRFLSSLSSLDPNEERREEMRREWRSRNPNSSDPPKELRKHRPNGICSNYAFAKSDISSVNNKILPQIFMFYDKRVTLQGLSAEKRKT